VVIPPFLDIVLPLLGEQILRKDESPSNIIGSTQTQLSFGGSSQTQLSFGGGSGSIQGVEGWTITAGGGGGPSFLGKSTSEPQKSNLPKKSRKIEIVDYATLKRNLDF